MVAKKHRRLKVRQSPLGEQKERNQETIRLVNHILDSNPIDTAQLRKVAAIRGLVNSEVRARAWPALLGIEEAVDSEEYQVVRNGQHRDSTVVSCDVQRSLWSFTEGWSDEEREIKREALRGVLTGVVCKHAGEVFYYQGLHDIASVLLFTAGEKAAFAMLSRMAVCHLRDCTRPSLDAVLELLGLLLPLLKQTDKELHSHIEASGMPPFFALSWFITWFAHNLQSLAQISRLFDLLLASHPLMPLYVSAVAMQAASASILACDEDPSELHRLLTNLPILGHKSADELAIEAVFLFKRCPPHELLSLSGLRMQSAAAAEAEIKDGHYMVPEKKVSRSGLIPRNFLGTAFQKGIVGIGGVRKFMKQPRDAKSKQLAAMFSVTGAVALSFAAMYVSRVWQNTG